MKLLIHDLPEAAFSNFAPEYEGWEIIAARGDIRPCVGCFGCWVKTPGRCVVKDGYEDSPVKLHQAEEIVFLSRLRYGCLSGAAKNVIDRCIGYVLPFFEIANGEMHHQRRYEEEKPVSFRFYGPSTPAERAQAEEYAAAVSRNMRSRVKAVTFEDFKLETQKLSPVDPEKAARTVLLNCSSRGKKANSAMFLEKLAADLKTPFETLELAQHLRAPEALIPKLLGAEQIVLGAGLYVDGPPSQLLRLLEALEAAGGMAGKRIYAVTNMGLYESRQLRNLFNTLSFISDAIGINDPQKREESILQMNVLSLENTPQHAAERHRAEHERGEEPCVVVDCKGGASGRHEKPEDLHFENVGVVARLRVVAAEVQEESIGEREDARRDDAHGAALQVQDDDRDQVAGGDGLEGVVVGADLHRVERREPALHEHAEEPEHEDAQQHVPPDGGARRAFVEASPDGERDGGAAHEDEERHDHVPEGEANPRRMAEVVGPPGGKVEELADGDEDAVQGDEQEHVDAAQEIEAEEAVLGIFRRRGNGAADGLDEFSHDAIIPHRARAARGGMWYNLCRPWQRG